MHNTMATTLRHNPDLYLHALLFHRSDQRYLHLKCLECPTYDFTTQVSLGTSQYSLRMLSMCEVSREVGNDKPCPYFRSNPVGSCKGVPRTSSLLEMLFEIILAVVSENVLKKVLEWCSQHKNDLAPILDEDEDVESRKKTTDIEEWDQKFMQVDRQMLFKIILAAVASHVLERTLERCSQHKNDPALTRVQDADSRKKTTDTEEWDQKFMQVDHEIILAANYMDIKALLDVGCKTVANMIILAANYVDIKTLLVVGCMTVANMIKGKPPEEIRKTFNIQNDFILEIRKTFNIQNDISPEDQIRRESEWADSRLEERNLLIKKTAGAGVATTLSTRRRGVTSSKNGQAPEMRLWCRRCRTSQ